MRQKINYDKRKSKLFEFKVRNVNSLLFFPQQKSKPTEKFKLNFLGLKVGQEKYTKCSIKKRNHITVLNLKYWAGKNVYESQIRPAGLVFDKSK